MAYILLLALGFVGKFLAEGEAKAHLRNKQQPYTPVYKILLKGVLPFWIAAAWVLAVGMIGFGIIGLILQKGQ